MKRLLKDKASLIFLLLALVVGACRQAAKKSEGAQTYTCPMHPDIVKDAPGSCPICKMDLVLVQRSQQHSDTLGAILKDTSNMKSGSIKAIKAERASKFEVLKLSGAINYNTNSFRAISSRVSGRIERLYLKYNFQPIKKGQKILEIYSPDLAAAEQELLFLKSNAEPELLEAAKRKLRLLGVSDQQINRVLRTGKVDYTIPVFSPYSGYLVEIPGTALRSVPSSTGGTSITSETSGSSMGGMGSDPASPGAVPSVGSSTPSPTAITIKEGQYVTVGQKLFTLVSAEILWAEFFISPDHSKGVKRGAAIRIESRDQKARSQRTVVKLIQPFYQEGTNYILARATIDNSSKAWRVGELIDVIVENTRQIGTWLPRTAVISLGTRHVAFTRKEGRFVPVYVKVKSVNEDAVDIGDSHDPETEFAENAWFLVDPESFIKPEKL